MKTTNVKIKNEIVVNAKIIQLNRCHPGLKKEDKAENGKPMAEDEEQISPGPPGQAPKRPRQGLGWRATVWG